jgi:hypothetical protein
VFGVCVFGVCVFGVCVFGVCVFGVCVFGVCVADLYYKTQTAKWGWLGPSKMANQRNPHFRIYILRPARHTAPGTHKHAQMRPLSARSSAGRCSPPARCPFACLDAGRGRRDARGTRRKRSSLFEPFRCRYHAPRSCCAYIEGKCSIRP